jgi:hypothetical protein
MKKGLGLQANISGFNTTLPQTKHLNFFMGTNPVRYANGGAVRRGVPSSNMNVTQGFLPMALGFAPGGEVSKIDQFYKFLNENVKEYFKRYFGKEPTDAEVNEFLSTPQGQDFTNEIKNMYDDSGVSAGPYNSGFPIGGAQQKEPALPTDTFSQAADATKDIKADSVKQDQYTGLESEGLISPSTLPQNTFAGGMEEGIKSLYETKPDTPINEDGSINYGDVFSDIYEKAQELYQDYGPGGEAFKDSIEETPKVKEDDVKKSEETPVDVKSATVTDGGIADLNQGDAMGEAASALVTSTLSKKEEEDLNKDIKGALNVDDKKDAPSWALPLMSAGFAMMASKSPNFLQALGEAGQEGIKTLTAQQEAKLDKEDREAQRELQKAQAAYYRGEGRTTGSPFIVGNKYYRMGPDGAEEVTTTDGEPLIARRTVTEIVNELKDQYGATMFDSFDDAKKQQLIKEAQAYDLGIILSNANMSQQEKEGLIKSILGGFMDYADTVVAQG